MMVTGRGAEAPGRAWYAGRAGLALWTPGAASVVLLALAMWTYAGGSSAAPSAPGYDLWRNYFCDLIRPRAHNGVSNVPGMWFGVAGIVLTGAALAPLWLLLPRLFPQHRAARVCRRWGLAASLLLPFVACTPSSEVAWLHTLAISMAALPAAVALVASAVGILAVRRDHRRLAVLTCVLVAAASVTGGLWLAAFVTAWPDRWALPTSQKIAWAAMLAWMVAGAGAARACSAARAAPSAASS